jgi:hypothetical protein
MPTFLFIEEIKICKSAEFKIAIQKIIGKKSSKIVQVWFATRATPVL